MVDVIKARSHYTAAATPNEKVAAAGELTGALRGLLAVAPAGWLA